MSRATGLALERSKSRCRRTRTLPKSQCRVADALKGQVALAFVILKDPTLADTQEKKLAHEGEMMKVVDSQLGAVARPSRVHFVAVLPKTRSGKLLRRSIQALAEGRDPGDLTTIEDPSALQQIKIAMHA